MIYLAAPKGLGDAIYLRAIALNFLRRGKSVVVSTHWPQLFADMPVKISPDDGTYRGIGFSLHHKLSGVYQEYAGLDQFRLWCIRAGIPDAEFDLRWTVRNTELCGKVKRNAAGRKVLMYQPRKLKTEFRPTREAYQEWVEAHGEYYRIRVGASAFVERDPMPCELDLLDRASVADVFDVATVCDLFFGEPCYVGILADALSKHSVCMLPAVLPEDWNHVTVQRMFHRQHLASLVYG